jgi:hypothetical protein
VRNKRDPGPSHSGSSAISDTVCGADDSRRGGATGLVMVGDFIGEGAAQERGIVGKTPNIAARLQALAEPDSIVIAESTRRLVGDLFEYRDLALRSDRTNRQKGRPPCRLQAAKLRTSCHRGLGLRTWGGDCRPSLSTYLRDATGVSQRRWASMLPVPDHPAMIERKRSDGILKPSDALCQHNFLGKDRAVGPPSCATPRS